MSPGFSVDDRNSLPQHRSWAVGKRWHLEPSRTMPLSPSRFFLASWSSSSSHPLLASHSLPAPPTFGPPIHPLWDPNPSWPPTLLQPPLPPGLCGFFGLPPLLASWPPTLLFWPLTSLFSLPPTTSLQPLFCLPACPKLPPSSPFFDLPPSFLAGHPSPSLLYPFGLPPLFEPPILFGLPSLLRLRSCFQSATFFFLSATLFSDWHPYFSPFSSSHPFLAFHNFLASNLLLASPPCFGCPCLGFREGQHHSWAILDSGKHTWEAVDHIF